jgi:hypothetical protein
MSLQDRSDARWVLLLTGGYALVLFGVTWWHYLAWRSGALDLGLFA